MGNIRRLDFSVPVSMGLRKQQPHNFLETLANGRRAIITSEGEEPYAHFYKDENEKSTEQARNFEIVLNSPEKFVSGEFGGVKGFYFPEKRTINVWGVKKAALETRGDFEAREFSPTDFIGAMKACMKNLGEYYPEDRERWQAPISRLEADLDLFKDVEMIFSGENAREMRFGIKPEKLGVYTEYAVVLVDKMFFTEQNSRVYSEVFVEPAGLPRGNSSELYGNSEFEAYVTPKEIQLVLAAANEFAKRQQPKERMRVGVRYNPSAKAFKFTRDNSDGKEWSTPISEVVNSIGAVARYTGKLLSTGYAKYQVGMKADIEARLRDADAV